MMHLLIFCTSRLKSMYRLLWSVVEDRDPDHLLEIKLIKVGKVPCTAHRGWCALVRKRWKAAGRKPWFLLNLLYAKDESVAAGVVVLSSFVFFGEDLLEIVVASREEKHGVW